MKVGVPEGKYILAVSGGVDSMALLDILAGQPGVELIVAHFNHGIRPDSMREERLVKNTAKKYGLKFELGHGNLDLAASEDQARQARYRFLKSVKRKYGADKIITA